MSMYRKLSDLFGRHSFDQHAAEALQLAQSSAPQHPNLPAGRAADHHTEWPLDWDRLRGDFATLRELVIALGDTAYDIAGHIDRIDPTAVGLARAQAQQN